MNILNKIKRVICVSRINKGLLAAAAVLLLLIVVLYRNWFLLDSTFFSGDAAFRFDEYTRTLFITYNTWLSEAALGGPNIQIYFFSSRSLWALLSNLGFSSMAVLKFSHFLPIAVLSLVSPFVFLRKLTKDHFISLIGAIFYGTTTYLFATIARGHLPIAFIYALSPLIFYFFILALEKNEFRNWLIFILIYWVGICYEPRIVYILTFVLIAYFLFFNVYDFKKYIPNIVFSFIVVVLLNIFWLLPTIFGGIVKTIEGVATRGIFGSYLFNLTQSFAVFHFSWTGVKPTGFVTQQIPWYFWTTPLSLLILSVFLKIKKYKKYIIFFWIISLIGIFIGKQESPPLPGAYLWLYDNLPTFSLFRNGLKFYLVTALGYMGLMGYLLLLLKENKNKMYSKYLFIGFSVIILLASLWNIKPIITGEIGTMFVPKHIPADYLVLKDFILKQPEYFRTMYVPTYSYWGIYTVQKPIVSSVATIGSEWKNYVFFEPGYDNLSENEKIAEIFKIKGANELFNNSSIKYVIVPIQDIANDDDFFVSYGGEDNPNIRDWYVSESDKVGWLKRIDIGTKELVVYENTNYKPHIYSDDGLNYYQTNASEFGDFNQNQNLYLDSEIENHEFLLNNIDSVVVPVEADPSKVAEMKLVIDETTEPAEKRKLQNDLNLYINNLFFKDFQLKIPAKAIYKVYFKKDSILVNNKNIKVQIDTNVLQTSKTGTGEEGWEYFNQIELEKGEHSFKLSADDSPVDIINSGDVVLSAENLVKPIQTPKMEYKQISPTKYIVNIHGASESFPLIFSESFHPGWKIYVQPTLAGQGTGKFVSDNNQGTIQNENLDGGRFYDLLFRKPVLDGKHFQVNGFANAWWVDIGELARGDTLEKKVDGTYDFSVIIEFEPQKYFYIGLGISGITLLGCLIYLGYAWRRSYKVKKLSSHKAGSEKSN